MKTCLIYGHNGLDLDVAFNLLAFYKKIGYKTFFSKKLYPTNLLVVLRATDAPFDTRNIEYSQIHVYDYGGWDYDRFVNSVNHEKTFIFTTSEIKRQRLIDLLGFPKDHLFIAFPPVEIAFWLAKSQRREYDFVHVGNFKKINDVDAVRQNFLRCIPKLKADIWGLGWNLSDKQKYHGKAGLFEVANIYAKAKYALGLMYPFQREVTFSGRFWHAPLNGCYLFSEKGLYTSQIPGVVETEYNVDDIMGKISKLGDNVRLQRSAIDFWNQQNSKIASIVEICLKGIDGVSVKDSLVYNYFIFDNKIRFFYQACKMFKFFT